MESLTVGTPDHSTCLCRKCKIVWKSDGKSYRVTTPLQIMLKRYWMGVKLKIWKTEIKKKKTTSINVFLYCDWSIDVLKHTRDSDENVLKYRFIFIVTKYLNFLVKNNLRKSVFKVYKSKWVEVHGFNSAEISHWICNFYENRPNNNFIQFHFYVEVKI